MKKSIITIALLTGAITASVKIATAQQRVAVGSQTHDSANDIDNPVHTIDLPHYQAYLPAGENRELFASRCLSCHSPRYMTMQPTMPQAKWEESVKKMIKTYGAPIAEDEAPRIAQYCVALQAAPTDELEGTTQLQGDLPALAAGDAEHGKQVYATACASCHGPGGKGDGPNMAALLPHASDLTDGHYASVAVESSVMHGVRGVAMPAFSTLSNEDVAGLAAYVGQLGAKDEAAPKPDPTAKTLYDTACASCHGPTGEDNGFNAAILPRTPTNFHLRQPSVQRAMSVLAEGIPGTAMPSWKAKFDEKQKQMLTDYVRSFYGTPGAQ